MSARPLPPLLLRGDCIVRMRDLPDESIDAIVTDPPYGLDFMGKAWDRFTPLDFEKWCEGWAAEALRVLKPGGHLLAFGGSRTWHRLAAGIEDAGFEVRDSIAWLYGSGFPKSMDVSKAIDKLDAAAERLARSHRFTAWMRSTGLTAARIDELTSTNMGGHYLSAKAQPAVPTVELFEALRPHLGDVPEWVERLVVERDVESRNFAARGSTRVHAQGITRGTSGAGGGGEGSEAKDLPHTPKAAAWQGWGTALKPAFEPIVVARKPLAKGRSVAANVLQYGTGALNIDAARVGSESTARKNRAEMGYHGGNLASEYSTGSDAGRWPANVVLDESQAAALDAQAGPRPGMKPALLRRGATTGRSIGGDVYGSSAAAAAAAAGHDDNGATGASRFFYAAKAPKSERPVTVDPETGARVAHPTVKPLALMRWLVRLVTPPGGVVLDPFAGSGTTLEAAHLEGFEAIGVELTPDYWPLIEARIERAVAARAKGGK